MSAGRTYDGSANDTNLRAKRPQCLFISYFDLAKKKKLLLIHELTPSTLQEFCVILTDFCKFGQILGILVVSLASSQLVDR